MPKYSDERPLLGRPVWVWFEEEWVLAALGKYAGKPEWRLLNAEIRKVRGDELWERIDKPMRPSI